MKRSTVQQCTWALGAALLASELVLETQSFPLLASRVPHGSRVPCPPGVEGCQNGLCEGVGHQSCVGGSLPLNPFGEDLRKHGNQWTKELCQEDSDGDGLTNGQELGDPCCLYGTPDYSPPSPSIDMEDLSHPGFESSLLPSEIASARTVDQDACEQLKVSNSENATPKRPTDPMGPEIYQDHEEKLTLRFVPEEAMEVPDRTTTYTCVFFEYPVDQPYHIVGVEPVIGSERTLHHMILWGCEWGSTYEPGTVTDCDGMPPRGCIDIQGGWTPGGWTDLPNDLFTTPANAGFRVGKGETRVAALQYHHDNPQHLQGIKDKSGLVLHLTPNMRDNDIGDIWSGPVAVGFSIPPGVPAYRVSNRCTWRSEVTIFAHRVHMHELGKSFTGHLMRDGEEYTSLGVVHNFDYNYQPVTYFKDPIQVKPGDQIESHFLFDSSERTGQTRAGFATVDEMAINHLFYYPKTSDYLFAPFCPGLVTRGEVNEEQAASMSGEGA